MEAQNGNNAEPQNVKPILEIKNLKTAFMTEEGAVRAVDGIDLKMYKGEVLGLVGESGCGKSTVALSILRLVPKPGKITEGSILFDGEELLNTDEEEMRHMRGGDISIIWQDPMSSLNPVFTVGNQISEAIILHQDQADEAEVTRRVVEMLKKVEIPDAEERHKHFPHEFSGGMRQRVMIAMALSCNPKLLIADEPTTSLDVTIQAQILDLMNELKEEFDSSILLITHNLGVVAELADKVAVMYAGKIVENSDVVSVFKNPLHPYTKALLGSIPRVDQGKDRLMTIKGLVPNLINPPKGCRFNPRCEYAMDVCREEEPEYVEVEPGHFASCHLLSMREEA